jgi:hypothetical protein
MKGYHRAEEESLQPPPVMANLSPLKSTKSHSGGLPPHKDVKNEDRPDYVYENKERWTKCTPIKAAFPHE